MGLFDGGIVRLDTVPDQFQHDGIARQVLAHERRLRVGKYPALPGFNDLIDSLKTPVRWPSRHTPRLVPVLSVLCDHGGLGALDDIHACPPPGGPVAPDAWRPLAEQMSERALARSGDSQQFGSKLRRQRRAFPRRTSEARALARKLTVASASVSNLRHSLR